MAGSRVLPPPAALRRCRGCCRVAAPPTPPRSEVRLPASLPTRVSRCRARTYVSKAAIWAAKQSVSGVEASVSGCRLICQYTWSDMNQKVFCGECRDEDCRDASLLAPRAALCWRPALALRRADAPTPQRKRWLEGCICPPSMNSHPHMTSTRAVSSTGQGQDGEVGETLAHSRRSALTSSWMASFSSADSSAAPA